MKTTTKTKVIALHRRAVAATRVRATPAKKLTNEEFRRQLEIDLADEIAVARKAAKKRFGHLLRPRTPEEIKVRSAAVRALFAQWEEENRKNPVSREESASYDRMLDRMAAERTG